MASWEHSALLTALIGQAVVVDLKSTYVCLGTLVSCDDYSLNFGTPISTISVTAPRPAKFTSTIRRVWGYTAIAPGAPPPG